MISRLLAAAATLLCLGVLTVAFVVTRSQGDHPAWWFVGIVGLASVGLGYGVTSGAHRRGVLLTASCAVGAMGVLGLLTIGLPLLVAAAMGVASAEGQPLTRSVAATP